MKHDAEYNTLIGLAVGDDMDAEAFRVVANIDNDQTTAPRCVFYEGQVEDGDKVLFLKKLIVDTDPEEMIRFIPGFVHKNVVDAGDRFEEGINGWCVLSAENPTDRALTIETLVGGVGETYIKYKMYSTDSGHGKENDPIQIIVWGR